MKFILINLLLIVCLLELARGYDYDEDDVKTIVKRQANYYNNYDYYAETTTVATTKKKLIKKCPTNAAGNRIKCKKKKKKTTTTSTTPQPVGIPPSYLRGPPGINPISFFIGPGGLFGNSDTTKAPNLTTMSSSTMAKVTSTISNSVISTVQFQGNFIGIPIMTGNVLPTGRPSNSTFPHMSAALVSNPSLNFSTPGENTKISPAGALQLGVLPKMIKSFDTSTTINVDPIVSGSTVGSTTPINLATTTGSISQLGSLVAPIGSPGFSSSSLNFFIPSIPTNSSQNITTTAKPAGLSNVTNSISSTTILSTFTNATIGLRPISRDLPMNPISNLPSALPVITSNSTTISPNLTTASSNMGSLLGKIGFLPVIPATNMPVSTMIPMLPNASSLTTASSSNGSILGKIGMPFGAGSSLGNTTVSTIPAPQTVLPSVTTSISTSMLKNTSNLPISGITAAQSTIGLSSSTVTPSTANSGLLLPIQPGSNVLAPTTSSLSSITISTSTSNSSLSTIVETTTLSKQKSSKTTKKKGRKNEKSKKKKQSKKTTKKAGNQQNRNKQD